MSTLWCNINDKSALKTIELFFKSSCRWLLLIMKEDLNWNFERMLINMTLKWFFESWFFIYFWRACLIRTLQLWLFQILIAWFLTWRTTHTFIHTFWCTFFFIFLGQWRNCFFFVFLLISHWRSWLFLIFTFLTCWRDRFFILLTIFFVSNLVSWSWVSSWFNFLLIRLNFALILLSICRNSFFSICWGTFFSIIFLSI